MSFKHVLAIKNNHPRDKNITFMEEGHKYKIDIDKNVEYISVTTLIHDNFPKFDPDVIIDKMMKGNKWKAGHKYWGLNKEQIKKIWSDNGSNASASGTSLHNEIECFMNNESLNINYTHNQLYKHDKNTYNNIEWDYFLNFVKDTPELKPYRTEWTIYDEEYQIAGSIDMVYENSDGTLSIYDWKRAKDIVRVNMYNKYATTECICHLPDTNFWHYALQLNIYKTILERNYGKTIKDLYLVRLHPEATECNYELIKLPFLDCEIKGLFDYRKQSLTS